MGSGPKGLGNQFKGQWEEQEKAGKLLKRQENYSGFWLQWEQITMLRYIILD